MGKRNWTVTLQPRPTSDGQERLVRALGMIAAGAARRAASGARPLDVAHLDEPAERRMEPVPASHTLAKEKDP